MSNTVAVTRGGGWHGSTPVCERPACRSTVLLSCGDIFLGFRCSLNLRRAL